MSGHPSTARTTAGGAAVVPHGNGPLQSVVPVLTILAIFLSFGPALPAGAAEHPLDPLSAEEIRTAVQTLQGEGRTREASLFPMLALDEPPKADVLRWNTGDPIPRRAFAIVLQDDRTFEARIDLEAGKVLSWTEIPGVQPAPLPSDEWSSAVRIVQASREWQDAVRARGVRELQHVICVPLPVGYVRSDDGGMRGRLMKVVCFDGAGVRNYWGRPIEGLVALVNLETHRLVRLIDTGVTPVPRGPVDFDAPDAAQSERRPESPDRTPSFEVDGHQVRWRNWRFHYRIDPRVGLVLSTVGYQDGARTRSVLYQASLSELFVPYMDPAESWSFRAFLDAGEQGVGRFAVSLQRGRECPADAAMFDAVFADDWGEPVVRERAACLFERDAAEIGWHHFEAADGRHDATRRIDLVLRQISAIGNYDYVFDWIFRQDGTLEVSVGATGVAQVKAVPARASEPASKNDPYGRLVADGTLAVNHDHFFSFRLDLDVDGPINSFVTDRLVAKRLPNASQRRGVWVVESKLARTEGEGKLHMDMERPALWRVINPGRVGPLGHPVSYELRPGHNAAPLVDAEDPSRQRAGFTTFHLWVTPYNANERYAAGRYPNQSPGGEGLPAWTRANRPIESTDVVLWYTLGFHHVARAEDWPVVPMIRHGFELRPFDFFERNPMLDLPQ